MRPTYRQIPLTRGLFATVDDKNFEELSRLKWYALLVKHKYGTKTYAVRFSTQNKGLKRKMIRMHRYVLNAPEGVSVDHINGNGLDNREENLRFCTQSKNMMNQAKSGDRSSSYKGVTWLKKQARWMAFITLRGKQTYLGSYMSEVDAARVYNRATVQLFGEFARLNPLLGGLL